MTVDPASWRFTSANPSAIAMFGARDEADFVSRTPWQYSSERQPNGRDSAELVKEIGETAVREGSRFFEWTCARIDGTQFPATILLNRIDCDGETILQATIRDITRKSERRRNERDQTRAAGRHQPAATVAPYAGAAGPETQEHHRCHCSAFRR